MITAERICLLHTPTSLNQNNQCLALLSFFVTPSVKRYAPSTGILTCCPSPTPIGLGLGSDLPWAESPGPGTLGFTVGQILAALVATHFSISSCGTSSAPCRYAFIGTHNALLPLIIESIASVNNLAPLHFRRSSTGPVSYYAFFKGWLLLSQPPGCFSNLTTFPT